jgi:pectate lyase
VRQSKDVKLNSTFLVVLIAVVSFANVARSASAEPPPLDSKPYLRAVVSFANAVLEHGRDHYGKNHTPLFVDGLRVKTFDPVRWKKGGQTWVLCNFASQQSLMRTLDGLSALVKDERYRRAAEDAARYALQHLRSTNGLIYWGGHMAWDLDQDRPVGQYPDIHEMKNHEPYYPLLWRVDPEGTRRLLEAVWAAHILDWSVLDYNRHAHTEIPVRPEWDHAFREDLEVPFPTSGRNLSFAIVTPSLIDAGAALAVLGKDTNALTWTRRLAYRWQQGRDPKTGLCGGQLSYRNEDRAQAALGHVHPTINEAKIVATYHRTGRYHDIPLAEMHAAEEFMTLGGPAAAVGREFIQWASDDLKTYARYCYEPKSGRFISVMTDGTPIRWKEARAGYYDSSSFAPARVDGLVLWNYALAYRLTRDEAFWNMTRRLAESLKLGDIGKPDATRRKLSYETAADDWRLIYPMLELTKATGDRGFLRLACRIGDHLLTQQNAGGLFPRGGQVYARTGDQIPLALLHLAAALEEKESLLPSPAVDNGFFHCEFDGVKVPQRPGIVDHRAYDSAVFYGGY